MCFACHEAGSLLLIACLQLESIRSMANGFVGTYLRLLDKSPSGVSPWGFSDIMGRTVAAIKAFAKDKAAFGAPSVCGL